MAWPTIAEVTSITGTTVNAATLATAISVIGTVTGRDLTDPALYSTADQRHLGLAIAWQAAWLTLRPTALSEMAKVSASVLGASTTYDLASGAQWLAPLATMALRKCSWRGNRTVRLGRLRDQVPVSSLSSDGGAWTPTRS